MSDWPIRIENVDGLDCRIESFDWRFARDCAAEIAAHWCGLAAGRPSMFDGRVFMMHRGEVVDGRLASAHFETSFSAFISWRDFGFKDRTVRNCFAMAALRGNDGAFVLAEMGAHTANGGKIYFPAGTPDLEDARGEVLDLDGSVLRELEEETGLAPHEVRLGKGWTLVDAGPRLGCMKIVEIDAPALEIKRDLDARIAAQSEAELAAMRVVRSARDFDAVRMPDFIVAYLAHMLRT